MMKMNRRIEKEVSTEELIKFLGKATKMEKIEFAGLCRILGVALNEEPRKAKSLEQLISDVTDRYIQLNQRQRARLNEILDKTIEANKPKRGLKHNGNRKN